METNLLFIIAIIFGIILGFEISRTLVKRNKTLGMKRSKKAVKTLLINLAENEKIVLNIKKAYDEGEFRNPNFRDYESTIKLDERDLDLIKEDALVGLSSYDLRYFKDILVQSKEEDEDDSRIIQTRDNILKIIDNLIRSETMNRKWARTSRR